jgi:hypothetical protein
MALVLKDRVQETTVTTGTGTLTLAGAVTGYQTFAAIGNGNTTYYTISSPTSTEWEVGIGTYTSSGTTLARTTVLASSNAGSLVSLSAGTKNVFCTYPSSRSVYADGTTLTASNSSVLPIANGGSGTTTAQLAMNAFAGAVTSGSYLRGNGTNVVMNTIQAADVPTLNQNTTGSAATFTSTSQNSQFNSIGVGTAGSTTAGEIRATNNVTAYYTSDIKFKENIRDIPDALIKVKAIGGQLFDWTEEYIESHGGEDGYFIRKSDFGHIAQKVEEHFPLGTRTKEDGTLAVDYQKMCALAFAAIKELDDKLEALAKELK